MRPLNKPLPGDLVIRSRRDVSALRPAETFVVTKWPDAESVVGGPYQSYGYALRQARAMVRDRILVWRDHAGTGQAEQLEEVSG